MSLFPAYSVDIPNSSEASVPAKQDALSWLTNQSFIPFPVSTAAADEVSTDSDDPSPKTKEVGEHSRDGHSSKQKHKKKKKKHHKKRKRSSSTSPSHTTDEGKKLKCQQPERISELEYYTDVDALRIYLTVQTLHRPACPKYRLGPYRLIPKSRGSRIQRYFRYFKNAKVSSGAGKSKDEIRSKEIELEKSALAEGSAEKWVEYVRFKEEHPVHLDSYQNHKAELAIIEKAMRQHPDDDKLLELYLKGIVKVFPTDEVLELIQKLIAKDNTNVLLWDALICNKQCSMAQCIVPNVLKLYEKSIRSIFMAKRNDEVMLKFFKKCAIFCRQAGLWEQFFGLVQLSISLNLSTNFASEKHLFLSPEHFNQLIEFEELILKSGLPMNEIWLRIEKLRSAFHFLPFRGPNMCSDPQRMVLQEDIVGFVYPLINKEYTFDLIILILKLMKYPFENNAFERCSFFQPEPYESDHSEQLLPLFLDVNRNKNVDTIILNLIKELNTPPSFVNTNLAFESYLDLMRELLISASEHFSDERNIILLLLYLKLERILVVFDKISGTLTEERKKSSRSRVKNLLKKSKYQNDLNFYVEYGLIEYEMEGLGPSCLRIFDTSIQVFCCHAKFADENDLYTLVLKLTEVLLKENKKSQAVYLMTKLSLNPREIRFDCSESVTDPTKLLALQKFSNRINRLLTKDEQLEFLPLEQYLSVNPLINCLKAYLYYMALTKSKAETVQKIEGFLFHFNDLNNRRHVYIREQIFEVHLKVLDFRFDEFSNNCLMQVIDRILHEYPENLTAIRLGTLSECLTWFQIRTILGKHLTTKAVLLMVVAGRVRNLYATKITNDCADAEIYKRRILNLLKHTVRRESTLRQNALIWRLYLRELFDQPNSTAGSEAGSNVLEQCRKTLYMALEACPSNKALYLDGAFFAPQELSQLLDLLMEKQLRIHAIPEELEILRNE